MSSKELVPGPGSYQLSDSYKKSSYIKYLNNIFKLKQLLYFRLGKMSPKKSFSNSNSNLEPAPGSYSLPNLIVKYYFYFIIYFIKKKKIGNSP